MKHSAKAGAATNMEPMSSLTVPTEEDPRAVAATRTSAVYARLRHDIVSNRLKAGEKLRAELLAERYGVGSTPVREALNRLTSEALVTQQDQRGFRVAPVSRENLLELTRTRAWVTEIVLRESIKHGDDAWSDRIFVAYRRLLRLPQHLPEHAGLNQAWEQCHRDFHAALVAACPSRILLDFNERLFEAADRYRNIAARTEDGSRDVPEEHRQLMEAVLARRTEEAIRLANEHTDRTTQILLQQLGDAD